MPGFESGFDALKNFKVESQESESDSRQITSEQWEKIIQESYSELSLKHLKNEDMAERILNGEFIDEDRLVNVGINESGGSVSTNYSREYHLGGETFRGDTGVARRIAEKLGRKFIDRYEAEEEARKRLFYKVNVVIEVNARQSGTKSGIIFSGEGSLEEVMAAARRQIEGSDPKRGFQVRLRKKGNRQVNESFTVRDKATSKEGALGLLDEVLEAKEGNYIVSSLQEAVSDDDIRKELDVIREEERVVISAD